MSQYNFQLPNGRTVMYGLDLPTGGFFFTEFFAENEIIENYEEVAQKESGLTLTELVSKILRDYHYAADSASLIKDVDAAELPTPLQFQINRMFGKDLESMLIRVEKDLKGWIK
jgi:hypothetical protein